MFLEIEYVTDVVDCNTEHSHWSFADTNVFFNWALETCKFENGDPTSSEFLKWLSAEFCWKVLIETRDTDLSYRYFCELKRTYFEEEK